MLRALAFASTLLATSAAVADSPAAARIEVPRAEKTIVVDGSVSSTEWPRAARLHLNNAGYVLLLHDTQYLYIALVSTRPAVGSICTSSRPGRVSILHSSGTLGAARYEKTGQKWELTRPFTMSTVSTEGTDEAKAARKAFLETEAWYSNTHPSALTQREYQLRIGSRKEIPLVISLLSYVTAKQFDLDAWPSTVYDGCVELGLAAGSTEGTYTFEPESWGAAVLQ